MNVHEVSSYVGLALATLEFFIMLPDEIRLIWRPPRFTVVKSLYLLSRYVCLAAQPCNILFARKMMIPQNPVPPSVCKSWMSFQVVATFTLLNTVDAVLMLRIYAFYNRSRRMGIFLIATLITRVGLSGPAGIVATRYQIFNERCESRMHKAAIYTFLVPELITQSIVLGLTFAKQIPSLRDAWLRAPVVSLLYRDGVVAYTAIVACLIAISMYARPGHMKEHRFFIFPIFIALLSSSACRMIINMQKVATSTSSDCQTDAVELTTVLGLETAQEYNLSNPTTDVN